MIQNLLNNPQPQTSQRSIKVFRFDPQKFNYVHSHDLKIINPPNDVDWSSWAILNDGKDFRLYFLKRGTNNTLYQFAFNGEAYAYGANRSIPEIKINNVPETADPQSISMLHDGITYRLYMQDRYNPAILYQFAFNGSSYECLEGAFSKFQIQGLTEEANLRKSAMAHSPEGYHFYALDIHSNKLHQAMYDSEANTYRNINPVNIAGIPPFTDDSSIGVVNDGNAYWMYFLGQAFSQEVQAVNADTQGRHVPSGMPNPFAT